MGPRPGARIYYGWWIVAVALAANLVTTGTHFYVFNVFMDPLHAAKGWTREQINVGLALGGMVGILAQLFHGTVVMRVGPRVYMGLGAVLAGLSFAAIGQVDRIGAFYALYILLYLGNGALGGIVANTAVNAWFVRKRGRALGIATMGISLAGMAIPPVAGGLCRALGLEQAFLWLGVMLMCGAPLAWTVVRNQPEQFGLWPDGADEPPEGEIVVRLEPGAPRSAESAGIPVAWSPARLARTPAFWMVGTAYAMAMAGVVGVMSQLSPRFMDLGFAQDTSVRLLVVAAMCGAAGKFLWGALCDVFDARKVASTLMFANALGLVFGLVGGGFAGAVAFAVVFGFSMGGALSTMPVVVADLFGRLAFTSVLRFVAVFLMFQNAGFYIMGKSYALTGGYDTAYVAFLVANLAGGLLVLFAPRPTDGSDRVPDPPAKK